MGLRIKKHGEIDGFLMIILVLLIFLVIIGFFMSWASNEREEACEKVNMKYTGDKCRKGNEFYKIEIKDENDIFPEYIVNKYPSTE